MCHKAPRTNTFLPVSCIGQGRQCLEPKVDPSPRSSQVFRDLLWLNGYFLRQVPALSPRPTLNTSCSYLSLMSARIAGTQFGLLLPAVHTGVAAAKPPP